MESHFQQSVVTVLPKSRVCLLWLVLGPFQCPSCTQVGNQETAVQSLMSAPMKLHSLGICAIYSGLQFHFLFSRNLGLFGDRPSFHISVYYLKKRLNPSCVTNSLFELTGMKYRVDDGIRRQFQTVNHRSKLLCNLIWNKKTRRKHLIDLPVGISFCRVLVSNILNHPS